MTANQRLTPGRYKLTVEDFLRLDEAGAFAGARTELLDGEIIVMNAEYRPNAWIKDELGYRIRRALESIDSDLYAMSASLETSSHDLPLPDIVLTREPRGEGPIPVGSSALVVEVSSTTFWRDSTRKAKIYARAGIPEYWIADVNSKVVHQFWAPDTGSYVERQQTAFGEPLTSVSVPGLTIATTGL